MTPLSSPSSSSSLPSSSSLVRDLPPPLCNRPNKVLKAKYLKNSSLLDAAAKPGCSAVWRSILWGKNLLTQGLRWRVGNGSSIAVFVDPWLRRPSSFLPVSQSSRKDLFVADFLDAQGHCWDRRKLVAVFLDIDIELILSIPVSIRDREDCWMWHYDKKGIYSVKSGYRVAVEQKLKGVSSSSVQKGEWWKLLWNLKIPPKVKVFLWRVSNDAIPSLANLFRRKIPLNPCCNLCEEELESTPHALFWCREVLEVWEMTEFGVLLDNLAGLGCLDILCCLSFRINRKDLERFAMILWGIWFNRNQSMHNKSVKSPVELLSWVSGLLEEFQGTHSSLLLPSPPSCVPIHGEWLPPPLGDLKLNTDAAVPLGGSKFGIGAVIRDSAGKVILALSKLVLGLPSVEVCEVLALREGLSLALQHGLSVAWVEVDAANVAASVNSPLPSCGVAGFVFNDVSSLCSDVGVLNCSAIPRCGNGLAHNLASLAISSKRDNLWQGYCPCFLFAGC